MSSDLETSPTLSGYGEERAYSNPLADNEMRKLIDKAFHKDAIWDAAIDVLLNKMKTAAAGRYFFYPHEPFAYATIIFKKQFQPEIEDAKKAFWDTISRHNISTELSENDLEKLGHRFEKRAKPFYGDREDNIPYEDNVLDAAAEVLEQADCPYTKWPEVPHIDTMSLQHNAEVGLLDQLSAAVSNERATATFACGGKVPIAGHQDINRSGTIGDRRVSSSVDVRWDSTPSEGRLVRFPITAERSQRDNNSFQQLLVDCQPATFGRGGEDVLDESYRKAGNSTRLNSVYSGPFGCFGPHVDTPRNDTHFASLVVCLPSPHQGGALVVRHEGNQLVYDWSSTDPLEIGWAAFYSDCEHEVEQMQIGHRITLAYNLYITDRVGWTLQQPNPSVDPSQMVLYGMLKNMLAAPGFLRSGGVLGVFCSHKYAHTNDSANRRLPRALKGVDFAVYAAFQALGLPVKVAPVFTFRGGYGGITLRELRANKGLEVSKTAGENLQKFQEQGDRDICLEYEGEDSSDGELIRKHICQSHKRSNATDDFESRLNQLKASRRVKGLTKRHMTRRDVIVGNRFQQIACLDDGGEDRGFDDILDDSWPHVSLPTVTWLNEVIEGTDEIQMAHLAYGNEAFMKCRYSAAAMFVVVPKYADRDILSPPHKSNTAIRKRDYEAFQED